jgi:hypothetical protein
LRHPGTISAVVIRAKAGIQYSRASFRVICAPPVVTGYWVPAFAGITAAVGCASVAGPLQASFRHIPSPSRHYILGVIPAKAESSVPERRFEHLGAPIVTG